MLARPLSPAARRYGRALHAAAREAGALDQVRADVGLLQAVFADGAARSAVSDPRIASERRQAMIEKAFGELLHPLTRNTIRVLARRGRLEVLPEVPDAFLETDDRLAGRVHGVAESALPLDEATLSELAASLGRRLDKQVVLEARQLPELIGGIRVTLGCERYDGSLRGRLERLERKLLDPSTL